MSCQIYFCLPFKISFHLMMKMLMKNFQGSSCFIKDSIIYLTWTSFFLFRNNQKTYNMTRCVLGRNSMCVCVSISKFSLLSKLPLSSSSSSSSCKNYSTMIMIFAVSVSKEAHPITWHIWTLLESQNMLRIVIFWFVLSLNMKKKYVVFLFPVNSALMLN